MTGHRRRFAAAAGSAALIAVLGGCAAGPGPAPAPGPAAPASPTAPGKPAPPGGQAVPAPPGDQTMVAGNVTAAQAAQLCSDMQAQLQSWRTYTPTIGKTGLNTLVGTWATQNGINLLELAGDRGRIDTITSTQCPKVRADALYALELPDLASGLVGF